MSSSCDCSGTYPQMSSYNQGSARVFQKPTAMLSNYGGIGYASKQQDTSCVGGYATLGTTYGGQPQAPAQSGYSTLSSAYDQTTLFSGPYQARQCLGK